MKVLPAAAFLFLLFASSALADSTVCAPCHPAIYKAYQETAMSHSFSPLRPDNVKEDFQRDNHYYHAASDTHYEMVEREGSYFQRRYQLADDGRPINSAEWRIDSVIGSGAHARTYLHRAVNGSLTELPLAWYSEKGGYWAMNPGYDTADHPDAQRPIGYDCMFCHNAYPKVPAGQDRYGLTPIYQGALPRGIDCQRCHGTGERHIAGDSQAILNPATLSPARQMEVCMQCHLETNSFRLPHFVRRYDKSFFDYDPRQPLSSLMFLFDTVDGGRKDDRFQIVSSAYRLRQSACFLKSAGALTCTTCHDPHGAHGTPRQANYDNACRGCHAGKLEKIAASHPAQANCAACHMPQRRTEDVVHVVMTDHYIQRKVPARDLLADLTERPDTETTAYHGEVVPYDPVHFPQATVPPLYLAIAQVRDQSNLEKGVSRLKQILGTTNPNRPEPYLELAEALRSAGQGKLALPWYEAALKRDSQYLPALLQWGAALKEAGQPAAAADIFQRASVLAPEDARTWNELGQARIDLGQAPAAAAALGRAIALNPELPQPHNGLGILSARAGQLDLAETAFHEAVRLWPNFADARANLANLLLLKQDIPGAAYEYRRAAAIRPRDAMVRLNYGALLNSAGQFAEAQAQLEAAVKINRDLADAHDLLGNLWERQGKLQEAVREYREAVRAAPRLLRAQLNLGATLAKSGDRAGALEHLRIAAKSSEPALREMAVHLISELSPDTKP